MREQAAAHPDLKGHTRQVGSALLLMTTAFILTKTGRDALYFQEKGLYDLPAAYIGIAMLSLPMSALALGMMQVLSPRRARIVAPSSCWSASWPTPATRSPEEDPV